MQPKRLRLEEGLPGSQTEKATYYIQVMCVDLVNKTIASVFVGLLSPKIASFPLLVLIGEA